MRHDGMIESRLDWQLLAGQFLTVDALPSRSVKQMECDDGRLHG